MCSGIDQCNVDYRAIVQGLSVLFVTQHAEPRDIEVGHADQRATMTGRTG